MKISKHTGTENKLLNGLIIAVCAFILFAVIKIILHIILFGSKIN